MQTASLLANQVRLQRLNFALFIAMLCAMVGVYVFLDFQHVRTTESEKLTIQANVVSSNIELHITSIDRMLEEILALHDFAPPAQQRDHMQSLLNAMPIIRAISILDSTGRQVQGTRDANNGRDFSSRPYYQNAQADPQPLKLHVSTPYLSTSGDLTISLSKAILDRNNRFQGVVAAAVEADYIRGLMESTLYTPDMWAALRHIDGDKVIRVQGGLPRQRQDMVTGELGLAQLPQPPRDGRPLILPSLGRPEPQLVSTSGIASYSVMGELPLQIITSRDYGAAMANWRRFAYLLGGLLVVFIAVTTTGLLLAQRRHQKYALQRAAYLRSIEEHQQRIRAQEQDYRIIVEHTSTCIVRLDENGNCSYANPAFCKLFGMASKEAVGRGFPSLMAEDDIEPTRQSMDEVLQRPSEQHFRAKCATPQGTRHMEWALCSVVGPENTVRGAIGIGHDISAHISLHEKLRSLAERDGLTGLYNRRHFMETATAQLAHAQRYGQPLSLVMLDLDHFKKINDSRGHEAGDVALRACARLLRQASRACDLPARIGGEEFTLLLPGTPLDDAVSAAERLREMVALHPIIREDGDYFHLTASFGVAALAPDEHIESLLRRADAALYTAKQKGRNRVEAAPKIAHAVDAVDGAPA